MMLRPALAWCVLAWCVLACCLLAPAVARADSCAISDITTLRACFGNAGAHERFVFTNDIACTRESECCMPDHLGMMTLNGAKFRLIDGQGHRIKRSAAQKTCPALMVHHGENVTVRDLIFDEDAAAAPCELADKPCTPTLDFASSKDITLERVKVAWGKGYVVNVWAVQGFVLRQSEITDAGIIGLYAGHYKYGASSRITVEGTTIARARTNGAAFQGADDLVLKGNRFIGNHWHGLWPVPGGGITPGGQLLIAQGSRISITGNRFEGGDCRDCRPSRFVAAIEVGEDAKAPGVHDLTISGNLMCHASGGAALAQNPGGAALAQNPGGAALAQNPGGAAVTQNPGTWVTGVRVQGNRLNGFTAADGFRVPARRDGNVSGLAACS